MSAGTTVPLHREERGEGPPVLCLHGTGTYGAPWWPAMESVATDHRVVTYDRRGFGESRHVPLATSLKDHVVDAAALITELDAGPVTIVGMSGGGPIALALAIERPDLVTGLILAEPAFQMGLTPSLSANRAIAAIQLRRLKRDPEGAAVGFYRWASAHMSGGNGFDSMPEEWKRTARAHGPAVFRELTQLIVPWPRAKDVRALSCPVSLVIADNGQPVFRRTTNRLRRQLPTAPVAEISGAGHLIPMDKPGEFGAVVRSALGDAGTQR